MASKVKKGFLYYIAWVLFIIVGIFCIFACVLIFNPGKDVFGINFKYVSDSKIEEINKLSGTNTLINGLSYSNVNVSGGFTNVSVLKKSDYDNVTLHLNKKIVGFSSSKNITYSVNVTLENDTLNIELKEPELSMGLSKTAHLEIICPKEQSFSNKAFTVTTTSGTITLGSAEQYEMDVKTFNATTKTGTININKKSSTADGCLTLNTESSNINVYSNVTNNLKINTKNSKVFIDNIDGTLDISATELKVKANKIGTDVNFSSKNGYINIKELGNINAKQNGNFSAEADKMHIANITINKMAGNLSLPNADASDITIGEIYGVCNAETTSGTVKIGKTYNNIRVKTKSGRVEFTQLSTERTNIQTQSGAIVANFAELGAQTDLTTEKANITVNLKDGLLAQVNYSTKGKIDVSWITTELEKEGTLLLPNTTQSTTNVVNITAVNSGNIKINNGFTI